MFDFEDFSCSMLRSRVILKQLEVDLKIVLPQPLKNLLVLCGYNNYHALADFNMEDITVLENKATACHNDKDFPDINGSYLNYANGNCSINRAYKKMLISIGTYASVKVKSLIEQE